MRAGLEADFTPSPPQLQISIPLDLLGVRQHYVSGSNRSYFGAFQQYNPATFSGFVNYRLEESYLLSNKQPGHSPRSPLSAHFDTALNYDSRVLEGSFQYTEKNNHALYRENTRLITDLSNHNRLMIGDLTYPTLGNQTYVDMAGLSVSKDFSLLPYFQSYYPSGDFDYFLERDADVEIWINQTMVSRMHLKAGAHSFRSLPFVDGSNNAELRIIDSSGNTQNVKIDFIKDSKSLAVGQEQYSYNVGLPSQAQGSDKRYQTANPFTSLCYRRGLTTSLTTSNYCQANTKQAIASTSLIKLMHPAKIEWNVDLSSIYEKKYGYSSGLTLSRVPRATQPTKYSWQFSGVYTSRAFSKIGNLHPNNQNKFVLSTYWSYQLPYHLSLSLGASYTFARSSFENAYSTVLSISRPIGRWIRVNLGTQNRKFSTGRSENRILLSVSLIGNRDDWSISSNAYVGTNPQGIDFQATYIPSKAPYNAQPTFSSYSKAENKILRNEERLKYRGNHAEAELGYSFTKSNQSTSRQSLSRVDARLKGAIVFADGQFGLSREISTGGFVLVKGVRNLKSTKIELNPSTSGPQVASTKWLPNFAVYPNLSAYNSNTLQIGLDSPPESYEFKNNIYHLFPSYRQGYLIVIGNDSYYSLNGRLFEQGQQPLEHAVLTIYNLDQTDKRPLYTFTGKNGGFQVQGLQPGNYEIHIIQKQKEFSPLRFTIHDTDNGHYSLGEIELEQGQPPKLLTLVEN